MEDVTFALALVLGTGFAAAKLAQFLRLPAVTGYICAGIALGPSGLNLITQDIISNKLGHFTQIALMLIAFGIGEHLEVNKLRHTLKSVGLISLCEGTLTFLLVASGIFIILLSGGYTGLAWNPTDYAFISLLLGSVAIATAPASTLHVIKEIKSAGPMTTTLLQVVVINNGMAIIIFGIILSLVSQFISGQTETAAIQPVLSIFLDSLLEIMASLLMGVLAGLLIDFIVNRLKNRNEMLIAGLSVLLLCGEAARLMQYSPLLAGIAAGFTIVNRDLRDVRLFRVLNSFEPPIHVLFFALAGAHLDISSFSTAGWLGLCYFLLRAGGKYLGARLGARLTDTSEAVRDNIGLALIPQAGIAIGLIFLINEAPGLENYTPTITTVILAGIFLSELAGPICTKRAMEYAGEAVAMKEEVKIDRRLSRDICPLPWKKENLHLVPWTWERLQQAEPPFGEIIFGVSHIETVGGLTRIATILAHYHGAMPVAVKVLPPNPSIDQIELLEETQDLFQNARDEAFCMGFRLETLTVQANEISKGILEAAELGKPRIILLGHPMTQATQRLQRVVEQVAAKAPCQVVVVRFAGVLHTERILVALTDTGELDNLKNVVTSLASIGHHKVTLYYLMPPDIPENDQEEARKELFAWAERTTIPSTIQCQVATTESRLETIVNEAKYHDLVVMDASSVKGLKRIFFGSLAESVAQNCEKNFLMVHTWKDN